MDGINNIKEKKLLCFSLPQAHPFCSLFIFLLSRSCQTLKIILYLSTLLLLIYIFLLSHVALPEGLLFGSCGWRVPLTLANVSLVSVVLWTSSIMSEERAKISFRGQFREDLTLDVRVLDSIG